ncbi:MAG TPA: hypothetical protein VKV32_13985 [Stellaceae bacterium]|nr:hypothetical protein [Stellaceae bacterium]
MQAKRRYRYYEAPAARSVAIEALPHRHWGIALLAACVVSWALVFGGAKLLLALI